ncbi:hypothetical protein AMELA_G00217470 [Ameiurus melas]|uniref:Uncharacterized protein n=1 Tax=Ameiurus melas TaxID=219545 RepID=A0A7J6A5C6_AMEME|nr:hypothetical protein AMELA_G00217470 [Ameiurus melas]
MANYRAFHTQLTTIMETLTRAAVAEICELVDDGYAILHMEISRHQKENEELRRKLQLIESIVAARGYSDETATVQEATNRRARAESRDSEEQALVTVQVKEEGQEPQNDDDDDDETVAVLEMSQGHLLRTVPLSILHSTCLDWVMWLGWGCLEDVVPYKGLE